VSNLALPCWPVPSRQPKLLDFGRAPCPVTARKAVVLNPMLLSDRYSRRVEYLRVSLSDRCNLSCRYCRPSTPMHFVQRSEILSFEELTRLVAVFASGGVSRVRFTGGEPTLRRELTHLVSSIAAIDGITDLAMTTNAVLLESLAEPLYAAGLRRLNVSLDTLKADRFHGLTASVGTFSKVLEGLGAAERAGFPSIKVNTVVVRGFNDDELFDLVEWSFQRRFPLRFIEFMPIGGEATRWGPEAIVPSREIRSLLGTRFLLREELTRRMGAGPARYWNLQMDGESWPVGFISAVSDCFCAGCNRARLTAEGRLRVCLADDVEVDLKGPIRAGATDDDLLGIIHAALYEKKEHHRFDLGLQGATKRPMTSIGG